MSGRLEQVCAVLLVVTKRDNRYGAGIANECKLRFGSPDVEAHGGFRRVNHFYTFGIHTYCLT